MRCSFVGVPAPTPRHLSACASLMLSLASVLWMDLQGMVYMRSGSEWERTRAVAVYNEVWIA